MNVEITIRNAAGDWITLDTFGEVPALNFQALDIAELVDRLTTYSQAVELPMSDNNVRAFGYANVFEAQSSAPYRQWPCFVYIDGIPILSGGYVFALLSTSGRTFTGQITSAVKDLYALWQSKQLSEIDFIPIPQDIEYVEAVNSFDLGVKFLQGAAKDQGAVHKNNYAMQGYQPWSGPAGSVLRADSDIIDSSANRFAYVDELLLCADLMAVMRMIVEASGPGYTFETDIPQMAGYEPVYLTPGNGKPTAEDLAKLYTYGLGQWVSAPQTASTTTQLLTTPFFIPSKFNVIKPYSAFLPWDSEHKEGLRVGWEFESCATCEYQVRIYLSADATITTTGHAVVIRVLRYNRYSDEAQDESITVSETDEEGMEIQDAIDLGWKSDLVELGTDDNLHIEVFIPPGKGVDGVNLRARVFIDPTGENARAGAGCIIHPLAENGIKTQKDFAMLFSRVFGAILQINNTDNGTVVRAINLQTLYDRCNPTDSVDWTNKIDMGGDIETVYELDNYAQSNILNAAANSKEETDTGSLVVNDTTLTPERVMYTFPTTSALPQMVDFWTAAGNQGRAQLAWIPNMISEGEYFKYWLPASRSYAHWQYPVFKPEKVGTCLVKAKDYGGTYTYAYSKQGATYNLPMLFAVPLTMQEIVDTYYARLQNNILNKARVLTLEIALDPLDILNLDLMRPVYLAQYGDYFFIEKISNYQARKLTKATLVCLNVAGG